MGLRPLALVTGASRGRGIGAAVSIRLASEGWDVARTYWRAYDGRMPWGSDPAESADIRSAIEAAGARTMEVEADLADVDSPCRVFDAVGEEMGAPITGLILSHCESTGTDLLSTTAESLDQHYAVNVRASWLLIREYARRLPPSVQGGRIVALSSDHSVGNLAYGATKAALDRLVQAAAYELGKRGVTANVVNPGATDTGWMTPDLMQATVRATALGRVGTPDDASAIVGFLCSAEGGWVSGQILASNGGVQ